ncbi:MAG: hypothetical protein WKF57_05065 [Nakamurella sp.]
MPASDDGAVARTVLGDVPARTLGVTNAHDHLMFASPLLPGQELDDPVAAGRELELFAAAARSSSGPPRGSVGVSRCCRH